MKNTKHDLLPACCFSLLFSVSCAASEMFHLLCFNELLDSWIFDEVQHWPFVWSLSVIVSIHMHANLLRYNNEISTSKKKKHPFSKCECDAAALSDQRLANRVRQRWSQTAAGSWVRDRWWSAVWIWGGHTAGQSAHSHMNECTQTAHNIVSRIHRLSRCTIEGPTTVNVTKINVYFIGFVKE